MPDIGLTHIALPVEDVDASIKFYAKYAGMQVVHRRKDHNTKSDVVWLSDGTRPFVIVLIREAQVDNKLLPIAHLGVGCESREEVDRLCQEAQVDGILLQSPMDNEPPVGYWAFISDPDGHTLEISFGQEIDFILSK
jgi:catechol 2,3-dioxygenase-like lactoylglutathione lyase family enzyme